MGKKKFIDKKKSATFALVYRESADTEDDGVARVFTRVDGGYTHVPGFTEEDPRSNHDTGYEDDGEGEGEGEGEEVEAPFNDSSVFADAEDDDDDEVGRDLSSRKVLRSVGRQRDVSVSRLGPLPEHVRLELVELGFADDGYDYLQHMRKIGQAGVGGAFVPTNRLQLDRLRTDVKVYDSSRVTVQQMPDADEKQVIEIVGSSTRPLRRPSYVEEGLDPEVAAALANSDGSEFDSADELEDDFVVCANDKLEGSTFLPPVGATLKTANDPADKELVEDDDDEDAEEFLDEEETHSRAATDKIQQRPTRLLDEQFEMLALREYDDDEFGELDEEDPGARGHTDISQFSDVLSEFLTDSTIYGGKYMTPAEINAKNSPSTTAIPKSSQVIPDSTTLNWLETSIERDEVSVETNKFRTNIEAKDKQLKVLKPDLDFVSDDSDEDLVVLEEESEDERSNWDCETVVSTLSNLDNHPGKITAPSKPRQKQPTLEKVLEDKEARNGIIRLRGKEHLPLDFLPAKPGSNKSSGKSIDADENGCVEKGRKAGPRAGETPEERKSRKAAVKEERRDARAAKKALKIRYKDETQKAQHGAAHTGPAGIHLP